MKHPNEHFANAKTEAWVGNEYRELTPSEEALIKEGKKSLKTNGRSEYVFIDHPDSGKGTNPADGYIKRRRQTNFTPPKKKRKKRK
jgi:hypothetical protein